MPLINCEWDIPMGSVILGFSAFAAGFAEQALEFTAAMAAETHSAEEAFQVFMYLLRSGMLLTINPAGEFVRLFRQFQSILIFFLVKCLLTMLLILK